MKIMVKTDDLPNITAKEARSRPWMVIVPVLGGLLLGQSMLAVSAGLLSSTSGRESSETSNKKRGRAQATRRATHTRSTPTRQAASVDGVTTTSSRR